MGLRGLGAHPLSRRSGTKLPVAPIRAVRPSVAERRETVRKLKAEGYSARKIAKIVGVSHETAANDVRNLTPLVQPPGFSDEAIELFLELEHRPDNFHSEDARTLASLLGLTAERLKVCYVNDPSLTSGYPENHLTTIAFQRVREVRKELLAACAERAAVQMPEDDVKKPEEAGLAEAVASDPAC